MSIAYGALVMADRDLRRDLDGVAGAHTRLMQRLHAAAEASPQLLNPARMSRCQGWTVGHVLTHLARNADSHVEMIEGRPQYRDAAARNHDIATGASRGIDALLDDVTAASARLEAAWAACASWDVTVMTASGPRPARQAPLLRWREVEWHTVDLAIGVESDHVDADYLRVELYLQEIMWRSRHTIGLTGLPAELLAEPPHLRAAWFLGRYAPPTLNHLSPT